MTRSVRGVLCVEGVQTGDSRLLAPECCMWMDGPMPIAWLQRQQHADIVAEGAVGVGTFSTVAREGNLLTFEGEIDENRPEGAEMVRRMEDGTAPAGNRWPMSIDPDNWAVQIVSTIDGEGGGVVIVASGSERLDFRLGRTLRATLAPKVPARTAAAGDPDVEPDPSQVLFEDAAGDVLERYTRLRIRAVTAVDIAAFSEAYMELVPVGVDAGGGSPPEDAPPPDAPPPGAEAEPVTAAALVHDAPSDLRIHPPAAWFSLPEPDPTMSGMPDLYGMPVQELLVEQPEGGLGVPLVITDEGQVYAHAALWGTCHTGFPATCVLAPESMTGYAHFHVGEVRSAEGERVATGPLIVGCDHASITLGINGARDHYANSGLAWADVRAYNGALGIWLCGSLRPGITDAQARVLRASALSGDWRQAGTNLEFITALAVNVPGFPVAREAVIASGLSPTAASDAPAVRFGDWSPSALTAAGMVQPRCPECAERRALAASVASRDEAVLAELAEVRRLLGVLELRTQHLRPAAAAELVARVQNGRERV